MSQAELNQTNLKLYDASSEQITMAATANTLTFTSASANDVTLKCKAIEMEELKEEEIVNKVGGRFKLSTLIQKRLLQLNQGSRALVDLDTQDRMKIAIQEIVQDKIFLDTSDEVRITGDLPAEPNKEIRI